MRPTTEYSRWINMFPNSPIQTGMLRFNRLPSSEIRSSFSDAAADFRKKMTMNDRFKTAYSGLLE
jgi:hypothetical protein